MSKSTETPTPTSGSVYQGTFALEAIQSSITGGDGIIEFDSACLNAVAKVDLLLYFSSHYYNYSKRVVDAR